MKLHPVANLALTVAAGAIFCAVAFERRTALWVWLGICAAVTVAGYTVNYYRNRKGR